VFANASGSPSGERVTTIGTSPTVTARWVTPSGRTSATRPTHDQLPAIACRRSQAKTAGSV
jgi:hypothetical protein